jgi:5-hydroxyisourate hydrolase
VNGITTHVLDLSKGEPAVHLPVLLEFDRAGGSWTSVSRGRTDRDGRVPNLLPSGFRFQPGTYRLTFDVAAYFQARKMAGLYREITVVFAVQDAAQHYHIPLLLTPFSYTVYRGS